MKKFLAPALGLLAVLGVFAFSTEMVAFAQSPLISDTDNPENIAQSTSFQGSFRGALRVIINYFLFFLGIIATVMVIYGGFLYISAGVDDALVEKAKNILIYAAIGIIVILISFALVNTLLQAGLGGEPPTS